MSMDVHVAVVLGLQFQFKDHIVERKVTKYDEDTGDPYEKTLRERQRDIPAWLDKAIKAKRETDDWHKIGDIGVFPDNYTGSKCLVGKLLAFFEPRYLGDETIPVEVNEFDKAAVLQWILSAGVPAETITLDDIKIQIGTEYL